MLTVLIKTLSFTFIIILGIIIKNHGVSESAVNLVRNLMLNVTLPAAIIVSLLLWFFAPLDTLTKEVIIMILFGPVNTVAGAYTAMCNGD